jgi:hypothetical protein
MVHRFYRHQVTPAITVAADHIERALEPFAALGNGERDTFFGTQPRVDPGN